jgi:hypothetical protein
LELNGKKILNRAISVKKSLNNDELSEKNTHNHDSNKFSKKERYLNNKRECYKQIPLDDKEHINHYSENKINVDLNKNGSEIKNKNFKTSDNLNTNSDDFHNKEKIDNYLVEDKDTHNNEIGTSKTNKKLSNSDFKNLFK